MNTFQEVLMLTSKYTLGELKYIRMHVLKRLDRCTNANAQKELRFHLRNTEEAIHIKSYKRKGIYNFSLRTKVKVNDVIKDTRLDAIKISDRYYINKNTDNEFKGYTISYMTDEGYGLAIISYGPHIPLREVREVAKHLSNVLPMILTVRDKEIAKEILTERRTSEVA